MKSIEEGMRQGSRPMMSRPFFVVPIPPIGSIKRKSRKNKYNFCTREFYRQWSMEREARKIALPRVRPVHPGCAGQCDTPGRESMRVE